MKVFALILLSVLFFHGLVLMNNGYEKIMMSYDNNHIAHIERSYK